MTVLRRIIDILALSLSRALETGVLQSCITQAYIWLFYLGSWYLRNLTKTGPATLGAVLGFWLARLFDGPATRLIFSNLGAPILVFYLLAIGLSAALVVAYFSQGSEGGP